MEKDTAHWIAYNDAQGERDARPLCRAVLDLAGPGQGRTALDLGAGAGLESRALHAAGWRVHAFDRDPHLAARLARLGGDDATVAAYVGPVEEADLPDADLVHASYTLPYVAPGRFGEFWERLRGAVRPGGWLAVDLFGDKDSWAGDEGITSFTRSQAEALFAPPLDVVRFDEEDEDGQAASGPKHWHVFHVIARRL
ncbi:class I SAM-dependent methyltransferase [Nocardioides campestrisoli]|uniref:class I SAM-dependent methyltransferase n=1 Tax=Nocardioides campestrisoli TaxID=2736757 RepID=UPI0015E67391|nr:class I SAM-dependent methyltransferase [Nocardioides campestrisoli]